MNADMKKISISEAKIVIRYYSEVFDIVRFVDPVNTRVLVFHDGEEITFEPYVCYKVWNRINRCENCISINAYRLGRRMSKFEFIDNDLFEVVSYPFNLVAGDGSVFPVTLELVNNATDEIILEAYGRENLIKKISETNRAIHHDSLTGVYNRRYFDEKAFCYAGINNLSENVAFIMLDLYNFKAVNDTYGHDVGDHVLQETGKALLACVRSSDSVIRYGGDEFLVVINGCSGDNLSAQVDRMRDKLAQISFGPDKNIPVTADFGWVYIPGFVCNDAFIQSNLKKADDNMYREKRLHHLREEQ